MQRRPLGCLTGIALVFGAVTVIVVAAAALATANGIFSPGPLSAQVAEAPLHGVSSHADMAGRCDACHAQAWSAERMADKCLACHDSVDDELAAGTGLHGRFATSSQCRGCHTEHGGATASLTVATTSSFPHAKTRFWLDAHPVGNGLGDFTCASCHPESLARFTPATCQTCHEEEDPAYMAEHVDTFGTGCRNCHDGIDTYGEDFAHASWKLEGKHADASCSTCHAGATDAAALRDTPVACISCHAEDDIHDRRLGSDCASCHTAATWEETPADFDHDQTRFALKGGHTEVECLACHVDRAWIGIGTTCESCHVADDPHDGNVGKQCEECHVVTTWKATTFTHAQSDFHLTGAHTDALCVKCHASLTEYRGTPTTCFACHKDDDKHKGEFGTDCASCHTTRDWDDVTFDHAKTDFPLTGAHRSATCSRCHTDSTFKNTPTSCVSCHRSDDAHKGSLGTNCAKCHSTRAWEPATFDHASTGFKLTGAHVSTTCRKCHTSTNYANVPSTCYGCHKQDDEHNGGFGTKCGACHTTKSWSGATVDHSQTDFPLTGAHKSVSCAKCHKNNVYSGTPTSCNACHNKPSTHQPDSFAGCRNCHTTRAWKPADFNQAHSFPVGHRTADGVCSKCHTGSWAVYTCSRCHSDAKMNEHHKEVSGYTLTTCARCHPKGSGD